MLNTFSEQAKEEEKKCHHIVLNAHGYMIWEWSSRAKPNSTSANMTWLFSSITILARLLPFSVIKYPYVLRLSATRMLRNGTT